MKNIKLQCSDVNTVPTSSPLFTQLHKAQTDEGERTQTKQTWLV